jgi:hypothetical protein
MGRPKRMKLLGLLMTTVISILKPGKDPNEPESFLPISLTSCICKIMERMVNKRLTYNMKIIYLDSWDYQETERLEE